MKACLKSRARARSGIARLQRSPGSLPPGVPVPGAMAFPCVASFCAWWARACRNRLHHA
ncbi:hypothetical protein NDU88_012178, partial [Pleurodeles waltl]